ncbi:MAG TPA: hypothetical protein VJN94_04390 [Candidatus Binataceae bacterium]|nr:hypothetical protein [Candidatus Binataceae bacterium]
MEWRRHPAYHKRVVSWSQRQLVRRPGPLAAAAILIVILCWTAATCYAQTYTVDTGASTSLTDYLRKHRLPLVGAQVLKDHSGDARVVLYGFVATDYGKQDAARQALAFLKLKDAPVDNRIAIRPEIANMKPGAGSVAPAENSGTESLDQILNDIDRYGVSIPLVEQNSGP